jgi:hypothetical protein
VWALEDAIRDPKPNDRVVIDGLASATGVRLNGRAGLALGPDPNDPTRQTVRLDASDDLKSISRKKLKTAGGIFRTNSFQDGADGHLFATLCRVNHACPKASNVGKAYADVRGDRVVALLATRPISKGDELLISYLTPDPDASTSDRLSLLKLKYGFHCNCAQCQSEQQQDR